MSRLATMYTPWESKEIRGNHFPRESPYVVLDSCLLKSCYPGMIGWGHDR